MAVLSPDNDYKFAPAPAQAVLDRATWDGALGSVGERLRALEAKRTELQDLIDDLSFNGQARLDEAIVPLITATVNDLNALQIEIAETIAETDAALSEVQQQIATILAGGIPAADVAESATRVFVTPEQRADIDPLRDDLTDALSDISALAAGTYDKTSTDTQLKTAFQDAMFLGG